MNSKRNIIILNNRIITDNKQNNLKKVYPTERQKRLLIDVLEKNPKMIKFHFKSDFTFRDLNKMWEDAARILNGVPGAKKTAKGWRKCWHDLRRNTKLKIARINSFEQGCKLDATQIKIMNLDPSLRENTETTYSDDQEQVIKNVKTEIMSLNDEPLMNFYSSENMSQRQEIIQPLENTEFTLNTIPMTDQAVNTEFDSSESQLSIAEKKLQLKKNYYDSKLQILERQTQIQERMLHVLKGIATNLIEKI